MTALQYRYADRISNMGKGSRTYRGELRERRAAQTRAKILDAVLVVMSQDPTGFSVPAVAREAGVAVPTVYRHYPNKLALVEALRERREREGRVGELPRGPSDIATVTAHLRRFARSFAEEPPEVRRLAFSPIMDEFRAANRERRLAWVEEVFADHLARLPEEERGAARDLRSLPLVARQPDPHRFGRAAARGACRGGRRLDPGSGRSLDRRAPKHPSRDPPGPVPARIPRGELGVGARPRGAVRMLPRRFPKVVAPPSLATRRRPQRPEAPTGRGGVSYGRAPPPLSAASEGRPRRRGHPSPRTAGSSRRRRSPGPARRPRGRSPRGPRSGAGGSSTAGSWPARGR